MLFVPVYIAASKVHGLGCFAAQPIRAGSLVSKWTPGWDASFSIRDVEMLPPLAKAFVDNFGWVQDDTWFVSLDNSRYINHSLERPNLRVASGGGMEASRNIEAGEELLENYTTYCSASDDMTFDNGSSRHDAGTR